MNFFLVLPEVLGFWPFPIGHFWSLIVTPITFEDFLIQQKLERVARLKTDLPLTSSTS